MNVFRSLFTGLITAAISMVMVVGGISLALTEGFSLAAPSTTAAATQPVVTIQVPTGQPTVLATVTQQMVFVTATPILATSCPVPTGWTRYMVLPGDTLAGLATTHGVTSQALQQANCLTSTSLMPGWEISLPPVPATATATLFPTATAIPCGPPYGWTTYYVRAGDTLTRISLAYNVSVYQLMAANCLTGPFIWAGQNLWVPNVAPHWPTTPPTYAPPTVVPSRTNTPIPPVATTTVPPTTAVPTTPVPTTAVPTTLVPTTAVPTTAVPTTAVPTTAVPTTGTTPEPTVAATQTTVAVETPTVAANETAPTNTPVTIKIPGPTDEPEK